MRVLRGFVNGLHPLSLLVALAAMNAADLRPIESLWIFGLAWGIGTAHELGHVWGARLVGCAVRRWQSVPGYGTTTTAHLDPGMRSLVVILGGPTVGFAAAAAIGLAVRPLGLDGAASRWFTLLAIAGMLDNGLNLLPLWSLDGAHARRVVQAIGSRRRLRRLRRGAHIDVEDERVWRHTKAPRVAIRPLRQPLVAPPPVLSPGPARVYRMRCPRHAAALPAARPSGSGKRAG